MSSPPPDNPQQTQKNRSGHTFWSHFLQADDLSKNERLIQRIYNFAFLVLFVYSIVPFFAGATMGALYLEGYLKACVLEHEEMEWKDLETLDRATIDLSIYDFYLRKGSAQRPNAMVAARPVKYVMPAWRSLRPSFPSKIKQKGTWRASTAATRI